MLKNFLVVHKYTSFADEVKARDYFYDELQKKRWSRWIDCVGRTKNMPLYANPEFGDEVKGADIKGS